MARVYPFESLATCDLVVDAIYEGGAGRTTANDPLSRLIPGIGNQGGFRQMGKREAPRLVVLYSSLGDSDWPDYIDKQTGVFTYFGDNKKPGFALHDTPRGGNALLRSCFEKMEHNEVRHQVPPFLIFTRGTKGRDVVFRGLAVPGVQQKGIDELVAIWRTKDGARFQNYRALFTILDIATVKREWIEVLRTSAPSHDTAPKPWLDWVNHGAYKPLASEPTIEHRTMAQQQPTPGRDESLLRAVYEYFTEDYYGFERCAAVLTAMMDPNINVTIVTRPTMDGGRDAIGTYRLGPTDDPIELTFSLEAKCYASHKGVGVKDLSRLISRLRHREFGILVTTSYLSRQAYEELRQDKHPVIVIAGSDIAAILVKAGLGTPEAVRGWLNATFPRAKLPT